MPRTATPNLNEAVARAFRTEAEKVAKGIAEYFGKAVDVQEVDIEEELTMWWEEGVTEEEAFAMMEQGASIDQAMEARFPNRKFMYSYQRPDPEQQVQYAKRMERLSKERNWDQTTMGKVAPIHDESGGELQMTVEPY